MEGSREIYCLSKSGQLEKFVNVSPPDGRKNRFKRALMRNPTYQTEEKEEVLSYPANSPVPRLYDQCMDLLAKYTHCFDSLEDFPLDIGRDIFFKAEARLLQDTDASRQSLEIFSQAYPSDFLPACSLSSCLGLINDHEVSLPALLSRTVQLEVSDCHIDDNHDLLGAILKLEHIEDLCLSKNCITDLGVRRLVQPMIGKKALRKLKYLDLSFNKLDQKSLKRIRLLSIAELVLGESDFSVAVCDETLGSGFVRKSCPRIRRIHTSGFAATLLSRWGEKKPRPSEPTPNTTDLLGGRKFYSAPKVPKSELTGGGKIEQFLANKIMYHKKHCLGTITNTAKVQTRCFPSTKRKLTDSEVCDTILFNSNTRDNEEDDVGIRSKRFKSNPNPESDRSSDLCYSREEEHLLSLYS